MKALVIYHSKKGTTKKMAEAIGERLQQNNADVKVKSIQETAPQDIEAADRIYMGCYTSGYMIFGQKPEKVWLDFARKLPISLNKKTVLFTTYKISTGSMFNKMRNELKYRGFSIHNSALKSKDGALKTIHEKILIESLN